MTISLRYAMQKEVSALAGWLDVHGYAYGSADLAAVEPYVTAGWIFDYIRRLQRPEHATGAVNAPALAP